MCPVSAFQVNPDKAEKNYLMLIKNCNLLIFTVPVQLPLPCYLTSSGTVTLYSAPNHSLFPVKRATYVLLQTKVYGIFSVADSDSLNPDRQHLK
jgi:hypothetical protein